MQFISILPTIIMSSPKGKQIRFSLAKKIEMLDLVKKGKARTEICREYGLAPSTLQNFLRDEKKVREEFEKNRDSKRQMIRKSPHHDLEQALVKWACSSSGQVDMNDPRMRDCYQ